MNADHKFAALDWNYASVQDTAGYSELKSIDGDSPTFEIDQKFSRYFVKIFQTLLQNNFKIFQKCSQNFLHFSNVFS